jgi:hypothetical protein
MLKNKIDKKKNTPQLKKKLSELKSTKQTYNANHPYNQIQ